MLELDVRGMREIQRMFSNIAETQLPYAMMVALNNTAFAVRTESRNLLETRFEKPTPLVKKATVVEKSTKENLTAKIFIDPKRAVILKVHETGGGRGAQRLERFLTDKGWLPSGHKAVPTTAMAVDAYGNPRRAEVTRIISALSTGITSTVNSARRYFVIPVGYRSHLKPGIYLANRRNEIKPLFIFVSTAFYHPMLGWEQAMYQSAMDILPTEAQRAVQRALDTAHG